MKSLFPKGAKSIFHRYRFFLYEKMVCPHVHPMGYCGFHFFFLEDWKIWITIFRLFPKGAKSNIVCFQKALNPLFGGACNIWAIGVQHSHIELAHLLFLVSKFQKQNKPPPPKKKKKKKKKYRTFRRRKKKSEKKNLKKKFGKKIN